MHDGRIPDHRGRTFFAESTQTFFQFLAARARLSGSIAAEGNESADFPAIAEDCFRPPTNRCRQGPQHRHGQLGHGLLESGKALAGTFPLGTTPDIERPGGLELLREAVAAAVRCQ